MTEKQSTTSTSDAEKPRKRKWLRRLFVICVLIGVAIAGVPSLVGRTSLRNRIVPHLWPELAQRVSLGSASLGWFSPIGIDNLNVYDQDGAVMLHADRLQSRYTLLDLILEPSELGEWTLTRATTHLTIESDTSNLEDF
ncbi:MAG TPA: hypothetical protein VLA12_04420, partial [Planctomycetaceae bacterium]|nr:hypothetical protein [Planctomycetaceae bacterium]